MKLWLFGVLAAVVLAPVPAATQPAAWSAAGSLLDVSVAIDGAPAPLYAARDGSGRYYLEALAGRAYELRLANRSGERLGVALSVDGLNAISGERELASSRPGTPGRMYVLSPWEATSVKGWRTSLEDVHRFTFVDERASYAARSGKANARMGWIEIAVYREERPYVWRRPAPVPADPYPPYPPVTDERRGEARAEADRPQASAPPAAEAPAPAAKSGFESAGRAEAPRSYPGTGWGQRESDRVVVVDFQPVPEAAERITLRYEYRPALQALGLLPRFWPPVRDRLSERERGRDGFVTPPPR